MRNKLAIVIPAYKGNYFDAALASLAAQTNKDFTVYIGDDASPDDLGSVAGKYGREINIIYHRFEQNLGQANLAGHWNRCVSLAAEEWIWLFSDDDVMSPGCVEAFYRALENTCEAFALYRFNIEMIGANGSVICVKEPHPEKETGADFLKSRLQSRVLSAAIEYIFKKDAFIKHHGFVEFPMAFCSDDATWITFAEEKPIYTIAPERIYWRASHINISSVTGLHNKKIDAMIAYSLWLKLRFKKLPVNEIETWFFENLKYVYGHPGIIEKYQLAARLSTTFTRTHFQYFTKLLFDGVF